MIKSIMLDLETMGTKPYSAIVAIGAVMFDVEKRTIDKEFYTVIELDSCLSAGLTVDGETVLWWLRQSDEARAALQKGVRLGRALTDFAEIFYRYSDVKIEVWGNGKDFDNVLLQCAYDKMGFDLPWSPFNNKCYRDIKTLPKHRDTKIVRTGTHHNALDDARSQAIHLIQLLNPEPACDTSYSLPA